MDGRRRRPKWLDGEDADRLPERWLLTVIVMPPPACWLVGLLQGLDGGLESRSKTRSPGWSPIVASCSFDRGNHRGLTEHGDAWAARRSHALRKRCEDGPVADVNMVADTDLTGHHHPVAGRRAAGDAYLRAESCCAAASGSRGGITSPRLSTSVPAPITVGPGAAIDRGCCA